MDAECETNDEKDSESEMEEGQVLTSTDDDCDDSDSDSDTDDGSEGSAEQLQPEEGITLTPSGVVMDYLLLLMHMRPAFARVCGCLDGLTILFYYNLICIFNV